MMIKTILKATMVNYGGDDDDDDDDIKYSCTVTVTEKL